MVHMPRALGLNLWAGQALKGSCGGESHSSLWWGRRVHLWGPLQIFPRRVAFSLEQGFLTMALLTPGARQAFVTGSGPVPCKMFGNSFPGLRALDASAAPRAVTTNVCRHCPWGGKLLSEPLLYSLPCFLSYVYRWPCLYLPSSLLPKPNTTWLPALPRGTRLGGALASLTAPLSTNGTTSLLRGTGWGWLWGVSCQQLRPPLHQASRAPNPLWGTACSVEETPGWGPTSRLAGIRTIQACWPCTLCPSGLLSAKLIAWRDKSA